LNDARGNLHPNADKHYFNKQTPDFENIALPVGPVV